MKRSEVVTAVSDAVVEVSDLTLADGDEILRADLESLATPTRVVADGAAAE